MEYEIVEILKKAVFSLGLNLTEEDVGVPNVEYSCNRNDLFFELEATVDSEEKILSDESSLSVAIGRITISVPQGEGGERIDKIACALEQIFSFYNRRGTTTIVRKRYLFGNSSNVRERLIYRVVGAGSGSGCVIGSRYKKTVSIQFNILKEKI